MLIGITGSKGSGKDTFAEALGLPIVKFADPLKNMLRVLFEMAEVDLDTIERMIEGDLKETPAEALLGQTPRHAMQTLGTEWRDMIDQSLWSNIFYLRVKGLMQIGMPLVCTDVRFHHEAKLIRELGGTIIRVHRPGRESADQHVSEQEMNAMEVDETFYNVGSIKDLHDKAQTFLQEFTTQ